MYYSVIAGLIRCVYLRVEKYCVLQQIIAVSYIWKKEEKTLIVYIMHTFIVCEVFEKE